MHSRTQTTRTVAEEGLYRPTGGGQGATGATGAGGFDNFQTVFINTTITRENCLVNVAANGVVVTIGTGINAITIKDRTNSLTPTIGVQAQSGNNLEDPNNLGNPADFAPEVFLKTPGGAVSFRFDGILYEVVSTT